MRFEVTAPFRTAVGYLETFILKFPKALSIYRGFSYRKIMTFKEGDGAIDFVFGSWHLCQALYNVCAIGN